MLFLSTPKLVEWCGYVSDRHIGKTNDKFLLCLKELEKLDYLKFNEVPTLTSYTECKFNTEKAFDDCQRKSFAVVYLDEIEKIMHCKIDGSSKYMNQPTILLLYSFLKCFMYRRPNKLRPEERNYDGKDLRENDIANRRKLFPEAYNCKFKDVAKKLGISERAVSKGIAILEELGLIVTDKAYRVKIDDDKYETMDIAITSKYKREGSYVLDNTNEYSRRELINKAKQIRQYNKKYVLTIENDE